MVKYNDNFGAIIVFAVESIQEIVAMRDSQIDLFIRFCFQNNGRPSVILDMFKMV